MAYLWPVTVFVNTIAGHGLLGILFITICMLIIINFAKSIEKERDSNELFLNMEFSIEIEINSIIWWGGWELADLHPLMIIF